MKKIVWLLVVNLLACGAVFAAAQVDYATLTEWTTACFTQLPEYDHNCEKEVATEQERQETYKTTLTADLFKRKMEVFAERSKAWLQANKAHWVGDDVPKDSLFDVHASHDNEFEHAFIQRLEIPANSEVCFMGDYHGSVHSLLRNLWRLVADGYLDDNFKFKKDNFYLIFLGDFVDRGRYGAEVWYTLMQLKLANWDKVHLLRGNHETNLASRTYGFLGWARQALINGVPTTVSVKEEGEVCSKFETAEEKRVPQPGEVGTKILNLYHFLPFAVFLSAEGSGDYVQCCHGGVAFNDQAEGPFNAMSFLYSGKKFQKISKQQEGFQWSDFFQGENRIRFIKNCRGTLYGLKANLAGGQHYLNSNGLRAFFRGHQDQAYGFKMFFNSEEQRNQVQNLVHSGYTDGPYHWKYIVSQEDQANSDGFFVKDYQPIFTFTSASEGQAVPFDCYGMVNVHDGQYDNWRLKICETALPLESRRNKKYVAIGATTSDLNGPVAAQDQQLKINWLDAPLMEHEIQARLATMVSIAQLERALLEEKINTENVHLMFMQFEKSSKAGQHRNLWEEILHARNYVVERLEALLAVLKSADQGQQAVAAESDEGKGKEEEVAAVAEKPARKRKRDEDDDGSAEMKRRREDSSSSSPGFLNWMLNSE